MGGVDDRAPGSGAAVAPGGAPAAGWLTTQADQVFAWARRWSLFQYPFVTACCAMEFMSAMCAHWDMARFGAEIPRWSPRQSDVLWVVGTIVHKQAPILKRVYDQMCEPKWVVAFGTCAAIGGFYDNYTVLQGINKIIPCDVYIPGCPPRPEAVIDGLMLLQEKIGRGELSRYQQQHAGAGRKAG